MLSRTIAVAAVIGLAVFAAEPFPDLRTEPTGGGSIFFVKNGAGQPLTAYLIELVDYPGSSYWFGQDDYAEPLAPGAEKRIEVANMTVGAAPEYVKVTAAIYADGSSAGAPAKVAQLVERRKFVLDTKRELIRRLEKAEQAGTGKASVIADLKQWAGSLEPQPVKEIRMSQTRINQAAARAAIGDAIAQLDAHSIAETLTGLRADERALAAAKP